MRALHAIGKPIAGAKRKTKRAPRDVPTLGRGPLPGRLVLVCAGYSLWRLVRPGAALPGCPACARVVGARRSLRAPNASTGPTG